MSGNNKDKKTSRFGPQAFLLEFWQYTVGNPNNSWGNFSKVNCDPAVAVNELMNRRAGFKLNDLTPAQLSLLVPKFRLEKVKTTQGKIETIGEFRFDDTTDLDAMGRSIGTTKKGKPDIVGLESFTWDDLGNNPANTGVTFKASMQLILSNMNTLFVEKGRDKYNDPILFKDLLGLESGFKRGVNPIYDPERTRIRATVGWTLGKTAAKQIAKLGGNSNNLTPAQIQEAVDASSVSFFLNLIKHDFDINENGMIRMTIDYIASIESLMLMPSADIFFDPKASPVIKSKEKQLQLRRGDLEIARKELEEAERKDKNFFFDTDEVNLAEDVEELAEDAVKRLETEIDNLKSRRLLEVYSSITKELFKSGAIRYIELDKAQIKLYNELESLSESVLDGKQIQKKRAALLKNAKTVLGTSLKPVPYVIGKVPGAVGGELTQLEKAAKSKSVPSSDGRVKRFTNTFERLQKASEKKKIAGKERINFFYLEIGRAHV